MNNCFKKQGSKEINHQSKLQFGGQKVRTAIGQTEINLADEKQQNPKRLRQ